MKQDNYYYYENVRTTVYTTQIVWKNVFNYIIPEHTMP